MQIPNLTLAYQIAELQPVLEGSIVRNVQELGNNWLKLRLQSKQGSKDLILAPNAFFLTSFSMPAKQMTSGYGAFLRKHLRNKRIAAFRQHGSDRIAVIEFPEHFLIMELFAKGNIVLSDRGMDIIAAFRKERWKDRELRKGAAYRFPSSKGADPSKVTPIELKKVFAESKTDVARALISGLNIAPVFAEAACAKAAVEKSKKAAELNAKEVEKICRAVKAIYLVDLEKEQPLLAEKDGGKVLLPFALSLPGTKKLQRFQSVNAAVDSVYSRQFAVAEQLPEQKAIEKKKAELLRSLERQRLAVAALQNAISLNKARAEAIYANYTTVFEFVQAAKGFLGHKKSQKQIMYKLKKRFPFLQKFDPATGKAVLLLQEK